MSGPNATEIPAWYDLIRVPMGVPRDRGTSRELIATLRQDLNRAIEDNDALRKLLVPALAQIGGRLRITDEMAVRLPDDAVVHSMHDSNSRTSEFWVTYTRPEGAESEPNS